MQCPRCQQANPTRQKFDQQTATSEILRAMSGSLTDVRPVFETIVRSGLRLLGGYSATMMLLRDGDCLDLVAYTSTSTEADASLVDAFPMPLRNLPPGERAVHDRRPHAVEDVESAPDVTNVMRETGRARGWHSNLFIPMIREDVALGLISITRRDPGPFAADQIALVQTFADQAVIAIENVRLFKALEARNRDLTATGEILQVIARSPTDVQPVFDAIAASATRLCEAVNALVVRFDGQLLHLVAHHNVTPERLDALERVYPGRTNRGGVSGRVVLTRAVVHVEDVNADPEYTQPLATTVGYRTALGVPMLREGVAIGLILVARDRVAPFSDKQIALLQTFADQAVIAVENVRLFKELEARNRDLTATGEILQVIARSPTDVQPVFDTIVRSAGHLCEATFSAVVLVDGDELTLVAAHGEEGEAMAVLRDTFPRPLGRDTATGRAVIERRAVHIPDVQADQEYHSRLRAGLGTRTMLAVPMQREGAPIGSIGVWRHEVKPFTDNQLALLQTFADQAVIAIENVRLFKELETRTGELTRSVGELTALGEVSQALSSTLDIETVLDTIVSRASQLVGDAGCSIYEYDEATERFELRATHQYDVDVVEALRAAPLRKGEGLMGRATRCASPSRSPTLPSPEPTRAASGTSSSGSGTGRSSPCPCSARTRSSAAYPSTGRRQVSSLRRSWTS
jgi:two-component system, NtrC family, sensor kinase